MSLTLQIIIGIIVGSWLIALCFKDFRDRCTDFIPEVFFDFYEIYKEDKSIGMIYEFKVCNSQITLEKAAKEGMQQIHDNEYYTRMQKLGIKEIWLYSIAFCQKKMLIKKEKLRM